MKKEPIIIDEPYTCTSFGRKNLKFGEISYMEDKEGQIDVSTVICKTCAWLSIWPKLQKYIKPEHEKDAERAFKKELRQFETNYNHRLVRRTVQKRRQ